MAMTETQSQETKGRNRLKGALEDLVQQSKEERDELIMVDEDVEEGARDLLELNDEGGTFAIPRKRRAAKSPTRRRGRKRGSKDLYYHHSSNDSDNSDPEAERHIPHVMTLFDRRVDLARFSPDTPLYVMCREWMSNNPQKIGSSETSQDSNNTQNPPPSPHPQNTFAPPTPLEVDAKGNVIRLDIPKVLPSHTTNQKQLDKQFNRDPLPEISQIKSAQLQRWKIIKSNWRQASATDQLRYTDSLKAIREMFQR